MSDVLLFVEHRDAGVDGLSLEALTLARSVASALGGTVRAVAVGSGAESVLASLGSRGVSGAHAAEAPALDAYSPAAWSAALGAAVDAVGPVAVVAPGSDRGNEVLAHLAARRGLPMAANVLSVDASGGAAGAWRLVRQRWAGSLLEDASLAAPVKLLSVAPHGVPIAESVANGAPAPVQPLAFEADLADLAVRVMKVERSADSGVSLTDAKVVVGGGRGVGSAAGFEQLEELARLLGGAVGGSRVVTSLGWRPHADQIGQTGLRIAPDLYIAAGISGAIQHIVGCKAAKRILAINTDAESPIMAVADYAVIGDLNQVIPAITAEIRRRRAA
jgi:electron transfer flavoprotein alpha subunit